MNKSIIEKRFSRSLDKYDRNAVIQYRMAEILGELVYDFSPFDQIFEIGCGTGFLTRKIVEKIRFNKLIANDIVDCSEYISFDKNVIFLKGDIEVIDIPYGNDMVISNATFQWLTDYRTVFKKVFNSLKVNKYLAFTTFGPENFIEMKSIGFPSLRYYSKDELYNFFKDYFDIIFFKEERVCLYFNSYKQLFYHIKMTGVNAIEYDSSIFPLIYKYYKSKESRVRLTYNPLYFILRKRS